MEICNGKHSEPFVKTRVLRIFYTLKSLEEMTDNMPNLNGFPTDNSSSTQLKYDIVASKFMSGIKNHQMRNTPSPSVGIVFSLVGAFVQMVLALMVILFVGVRWICKKN